MVWFKEKKGNGFEVQSARLGSLKQRILDCKKRVLAYINGEIDEIEELEEDIIDVKNIDDYHNLSQRPQSNIIGYNRRGEQCSPEAKTLS